MNNNNTFFFGYCVVVGENEDYTSKKPYKALRNAFVDEICTTVIPAPKVGEDFDSCNKDYFDNTMFSCIETKKRESESEDKIFVLVVPSINHLGSSGEQAIENYTRLIESTHIIILDRPAISTYTIENEELIPIEDKEARQKLICKLIPKAKPRKNKKSILQNPKFKVIFWQFQNYTIPVEVATKVLNVSKPTFIRFSKEYMTSPETRDEYKKEFDELLPDFKEKPVRGATLDDDATKILIACQRRMGDEWDYNMVPVIAEMLNYKMEYIPQDYYRFKHNYLTGRRQMFVCSEKYNNDSEIINRISDYFGNPFNEG